MISVAVVCPDGYIEFMNKVIADYNFGCDFYSYTYKDLNDINNIYADCQKKCDVIFFYGELGYHYIRRTYPDIKIPCSYIACSTIDVLSLLLDFTQRHPHIPLNRVYADFLTPLNDFMNLKEYVSKEFMPYCFEDSIYDYEHITDRAYSLWKSGKIDMVISRSINNLPVMKSLGIPYEPFFPTEFMIKESIEKAINRIRLANENTSSILTIIFKFTSLNDLTSEEREYHIVTFHKHLLDFRRRSEHHYEVKGGFDRFQLHIKVPYKDDFMSHLQDLAKYMYSHSELPFAMGAGFHDSEDTSQYYGEMALQESIRCGCSDGFLVSGEVPKITGPLSSAAYITSECSNDKVKDFSKKNGINHSNLLKLMGLYRKNPDEVITAAILSHFLSITQRSANRILQQLLKTDMITEVSHGHDCKKGRPVRTYKFNDSAIKAEFF